ATPLGGIDALLSIVQMPKGVPVASVAIGKWAADNAGPLAAQSLAPGSAAPTARLLAPQILALGDAALAARLAAYRKRLADEVDERARRVAAQLKSDGPPKSGAWRPPGARAAS